MFECFIKPQLIDANKEADHPMIGKIKIIEQLAFQSGKVLVKAELMDVDAEAKIYFVCIKFSRLVHAQGLGFTDFICVYAFGKSSEDAGEKALNYYKKARGLTGKVTSSNIILNQELSSYTFPEQIIRVSTTQI